MRLVAFRALQDPAKLRELLTSPESDTVERKREADRGTITKFLSAFANSIGGWLLLGVDDDGSIFGWDGGGKAHLRDWIRDLLDKAEPPIERFDADRFTVDGKTVGIVRVPQSANAPHYVSDVVWIRRNGQTIRAGGEEIRRIAARDTSAMRNAAADRLRDLEDFRDLADALDAPRQGTAMPGRHMASIVRVSLLDPTADLDEWVFLPEAMASSEEYLRRDHRAFCRFNPDLDIRLQVGSAVTGADGHTATAEWHDDPISNLAIAWDRRGLAGIAASGQRNQDAPWKFISRYVRDQWLVSPIAHLFGGLAQAGQHGPAIVAWDLYGVRGAEVIGTEADGQSVAAHGFIPDRYANALALTVEVDLADDPVDVAAQLWTRLERLAGAQRYDN